MIKKARATQLKTEFLIRSEGGYVLSWRGLQETLLDMSYDRRTSQESWSKLDLEDPLPYLYLQPNS